MAATGAHPRLTSCGMTSQVPTRVACCLYHAHLSSFAHRSLRPAFMHGIHAWHSCMELRCGQPASGRAERRNLPFHSVKVASALAQGVTESDSRVDRVRIACFRRASLGEPVLREVEWHFRTGARLTRQQAGRGLNCNLDLHMHVRGMAIMHAAHPLSEWLHCVAQRLASNV